MNDIKELCLLREIHRSTSMIRKNINRFIQDEKKKGNKKGILKDSLDSFIMYNLFFKYNDLILPAKRDVKLYERKDDKIWVDIIIPLSDKENERLRKIKKYIMSKEYKCKLNYIELYNNGDFYNLEIDYENDNENIKDNIKLSKEILNKLVNLYKGRKNDFNKFKLELYKLCMRYQYILTSTNNQLAYDYSIINKVFPKIKIELFASPFNFNNKLHTNYCSIFKQDKIFNSYGPFLEFIKNYKHNNLYASFNPPYIDTIMSHAIKCLLEKLNNMEDFIITSSIPVWDSENLYKIAETSANKTISNVLKKQALQYQDVEYEAYKYIKNYKYTRFILIEKRECSLFTKYDLNKKYHIKPCNNYMIVISKNKRNKQLSMFFDKSTNRLMNIYSNNNNKNKYNPFIRIL